MPRRRFHACPVSPARPAPEPGSTRPPAAAATPMSHRCCPGARQLLTRCVDLCWDRDSCCCGVVAEVIEGGERGCAGLDGVAGLAQQAADFAEVPAEGIGPELAEGGDGGLRQAA